MRLPIPMAKLFATVPAAAGNPLPVLQVVPSVDLNRYLGKWYEIARLPNWFQRDCASSTTAEYDLRPPTDRSM